VPIASFNSASFSRNQPRTGNWYNANLPPQFTGEVVTKDRNVFFVRKGWRLCALVDEALAFLAHPEYRGVVDAIERERWIVPQDCTLSHVTK
jgi:hypothetical protein